jgi:uncharacterized protein YxjI
MRYIMRERILSWGDDFTIKDTDGRNTYYVDGKVFSFGDKLSFNDMEGNELARIDQKLLSIGPQYEIIRGGATVAVVKKHLFTLFRARFSVDVPGPDDLEAKGTSSITNTPSSAAAARWRVPARSGSVCRTRTRSTSTNARTPC